MPDYCLVYGRFRFARDDIFLDPLVQPLGIDNNNGTMAMTAVRRIMAEIEGVHTTGGLSNSSFGLPQRRVINRCFLSMMIAKGFDSAIMGPLDEKVMTHIITSDMIAGNDDFFMQFIKATRPGIIGGQIA